MSYKIVEVKFLGTNNKKTYLFRTKMNLEFDKWYDIYTKESGGYASPIKVLKEHSTTQLPNFSMYKEIIAAREVLYAKLDETEHSINTDSSSPKDGYIDQVWFNPAKGTTVVRWTDGSKTIVRCQEGDSFDKEKGLALCYMKRTLDNKGNFNETLKKWCPIEETKEQKPSTKTVSKVVNYSVKDRVDEVKERVESVEEKVNQIEAGLNCGNGADLSQFINLIFPIKGE